MAAANAPGQVLVRWCGTVCPMDVSPSDTVGDLKRKFAHIQQLPSKRQKIKVATIDDNELNDQVLLSSLPNTLNIYGLNQTDNASYTELFRGHETNYKCHVTEQNENLEDFDGGKVGMSKVIYEAVSIKIDCLLKMEDKKTPLDRASFELIQMFRHPNSIAMENVFRNGKDLCLILSDSVDGTVDGYIRKWGSDVVLDSYAKTCSVFFTNLLTDLCEVLDRLIAEGICPKSLTTNQMYLKMVNGKPQLKVLFNSVESLAKTNDHKKVQLKKLCGDIKGIIRAYVRDENVMNDGTKCFLSFLGNEASNFFGFNLKMVVQSYPHNWTDETRGRYLIDLISSSLQVWDKINDCGINWPSNEAGNDFHEEFYEIRYMIEEDNRRKQQRKRFLELQKRTEEASKITWHEWNYQKKFPSHLVRLSRNLWKHYNTLPWDLKKHLGFNRAGALRALERWCPGVWYLIYNAVGLTCKFVLL